MLSPLIQRPPRNLTSRSKERGFTMALVTVALLSIIAMAALSIDIGILYQAKAEAQRAADAAALAAARVISISGITGDPANIALSWQPTCGGDTSAATQVAKNVARKNLIAGAQASTVNVYYGTNAGVGTNTDCSSLGTSFGVNPIVTVYVQQAKLPTFFARVFSLLPTGTSSNSGVSATATAEAFNPSGSGTPSASDIKPVQPRCVKPWIIPNTDPGNLPNGFVSPAGNIANPGTYNANTAVIGETFSLDADCKPGPNSCNGGNRPNNPPVYTFPPPPRYLQYVPAAVSGNPGAVPSCAAAANVYQQAIAGCDQNTRYTCGTPSGAAGATTLDFNENPVNPDQINGDTSTATQCLINRSAGTAANDSLDTTTFPFQIKAGSGNPLAQSGIVSANDVVTTSNSIVTLPIYDDAPLGSSPSPPVTIVGFLQVFINNVDPTGHLNVTVLNLSGCSGNASNSPVTGTSPVPVRLVTRP
jgi:hypothetical protein